jgi:hypothetical protein
MRGYAHKQMAAEGAGMCRCRKPAQMQKLQGEAAWKRGCVHKGMWWLGGTCVGGHVLAPRTGMCIRQGDHRLTQWLRASATVLATMPEAINQVSTLDPMCFPPWQMHVPTCTCPHFPATSPHSVHFHTCPLPLPLPTFLHPLLPTPPQFSLSCTCPPL